MGNKTYIDFKKFGAKRDLILDILYISSTSGRLADEELTWVAKQLYELTDEIKSDVEIFKEVRDEIEEGRRI